MDRHISIIIIQMHFNVNKKEFSKSIYFEVEDTTVLTMKRFTCIGFISFIVRTIGEVP